MVCGATPHPVNTHQPPLMDAALLDPFQGEGTFRSQKQQQQQHAETAAAGVKVSPMETDVYADGEPESPVYRGEASSNACVAFLQRVVPHGGSLSGMVNLSSATLGASIISLPYAFKSSGLAVSCLALAAITTATVFAIHLLVLVGEKRNIRSYEEMARVLIGAKFGYLVAFLMWFFCFGTCVAYVIALGDVFMPFLGVGNGDGFFQSEWGQRTVVTVVWVLGMLPLSIPKEINSLRYFSLVAVSLISFFVLVMVYHCIRFGMTSNHLAQLQSFRGGVQGVEGMALFMFAFMCQINAFEVYFEMHPRSVSRMTSDASLCMSICCLLYITAGTMGYLDFLDSTHDAVLKNYDPKSDALVAITFIGIAFKLCVGFSLCIQPARDAVFYALNMGDYHKVPTWKRLVVVVSLAIAALIFGLFIPKISIVFSILGSLIGGLVGFACPAIFAMRGLENWSVAAVGRRTFYGAWALLIGGLTAFVVGTVASILDIAGVK